MRARRRRGLLTVAVLALTLVTAGCTSSPADVNDTDRTQDAEEGESLETTPSASDGGDSDGSVDSSNVGESTSVTGFAYFTLFEAGLGAIYSGPSEDLAPEIQARLPYGRTWSLALFLDESFIASVEDPRGIVRDHGAVLAVADFKGDRERVHYLAVTGRVVDLADFIDSGAAVPPVRLIIAETYEEELPREYDLPPLFNDFEAITADRIATHLTMQAFAFGTTLNAVAQSAAGPDSEIPFDVGAYDAFHVALVPGSNLVESWHLPVVMLQRGTGSEFLGDRVRIEGFLVPEERLREEARERVPLLRDLAEGRVDLQSGAEAYRGAALGQLPSPYLSRAVEAAEDRAANQHRIPGYFLAYAITPLASRGSFPLQGLSSAGFPGDELAIHVTTQGYATGTTAEVVCKTVTGPECELPYDLGVYHLLNFTIGETGDRAAHFWHVPVVFPARTIPPELLAPVLTPVTFHGVWIQDSVARDRLFQALEERATSDGVSTALLRQVDEPRPWSTYVTPLDGFLYAFELEVRSPLHSVDVPDTPGPRAGPPTVTLQLVERCLPDPCLRVSWTASGLDAFEKYEVHRRGGADDWAFVAAIDSAVVTTYRDEGVACKTDYDYKVRLYAGGQVVESAERSGTSGPQYGYCY